MPTAPKCGKVKKPHEVGLGPGGGGKETREGKECRKLVLWRQPCMMKLVLCSDIVRERNLQCRGPVL